jgi:predicted DNA-binding protein with PD1-like motif
MNWYLRRVSRQVQRIVRLLTEWAWREEIERRYTVEEVTAWLSEYHGRYREIEMTLWIQMRRDKQNNSIRRAARREGIHDNG